MPLGSAEVRVARQTTPPEEHPVSVAQLAAQSLAQAIARFRLAERAATAAIARI